MAAAANCYTENEVYSEENTPKLGQHMFSEAWDESDVTLVVEDKRFHVHRMLLSIHSPVFRTMFSSDFREKEAAEITLPGKKAKEILDLLNQVYPQQPENLTMENVEHMLKLADEYQMQRIIQSCGRFLKAEPKTTTNAMEILLLAQTNGFSEVCDECHVPLAELSFKELQDLEGFEMLDGENTRKLLVPHLHRAEQMIQAAEQKSLQHIAKSEQKVKEAEKTAASAEKKAAKNCEKLLRDVHLQLKGMIECALYFALGGKSHYTIPKCSDHFDGSSTKRKIRWYNSISCPSCNKMVEEIACIAYNISPSINTAAEDLTRLLRELSNV